MKGLWHLWRKPLTGFMFREVNIVHAPPVSGGGDPDSAATEGFLALKP